MTDKITLRENSQGTLLFTLRSGGEDFDPTGMEVKMMRKTKKGIEDIISTEDSSPILTIVGGQLRLIPDADTWEGAGSGWNYDIYFLVETSTDVWISFPESDNMRIAIIPWT